MKQYVMVPVPEEIVDEVETFVRRLAAADAAAKAQGDLAVLARELGNLDQDFQTVLTKVAHATVGGRLVSLGELAELLGCSVREVLGLSIEVTSVVSRLGGPSVVVMPGASPSGSTTTADYILSMHPAVARAILEAKGSPAGGSGEAPGGQGGA